MLSKGVACHGNRVDIHITKDKGMVTNPVKHDLMLGINKAMLKVIKRDEPEYWAWLVAVVKEIDGGK